MKIILSKATLIVILTLSYISSAIASDDFKPLPGIEIQIDTKTNNINPPKSAESYIHHWPWTEHGEYLWYVQNLNWDKRIGFVAKFYQANPDSSNRCLRYGKGAGSFSTFMRCNGNTRGLKAREMGRAFPDEPECGTRFIIIESAEFCD